MDPHARSDIVNDANLSTMGSVVIGNALEENLGDLRPAFDVLVPEGVVARIRLVRVDHGLLTLQCGLGVMSVKGTK